MLLLLFLVLARLRRASYGAKNPSSTGKFMNKTWSDRFQIQVNFDIDEVLHAIATHEETTYKDLEIQPLVLPSYKDLPPSKTNNIS